MLTDQEIDYVFREFGSLMTVHEKAAWKHSVTSAKIDSSENFAARREMSYQKGWLTRDPLALDLLKNGFEIFKCNTANRIAEAHPNRVFFNRCPECKQLARTKLARQCRCGYSWHHLYKANFQINSSFNIIGRGCCITGQILSGNIAIGMRADLTAIGLTVRPIISDFGFLRHSESKTEDTGLVLYDLPAFEESYLKANEPFHTPIPIML